MATTLTRARFAGRRYTIDELEALRLFAKGVHYELLDGHLVVSPLASRAHQHLCIRIASLIDDHIAGNHGAVYSPGAIIVPPGLEMQPDVLVIPFRRPWSIPWEAITKWWLAVEVLSPSHRDSDLGFKRSAYLELGIPEVWFLDPDARSVRIARRGVDDVELAPPMVLTWHAPGAPGPLAIDLAALFADD